MHLKQAAGYNDRTVFDVYRAATGWQLAAFKGQLLPADKFTPIWNKPTRKRKINTKTGVPTESFPVVRAQPTGEIFMMGTVQQDALHSTAYRKSAGLHMVSGTAVVSRLSPIGPVEDPGWAVNTLVATTYGDTELRSVNESQDTELDNYGHSFLLLPHDIDLQRHDTVELQILGARTNTFYVLNVYIDSGMISARVTESPDVRVNIVYVRVGSPVYDPNTGTNVPVETSFNVTAKVDPLGTDDQPSSDYSPARIKVMVKQAWFPGAPQNEDKFVYHGGTYTITSFDSDPEQEEWTMRATK